MTTEEYYEEKMNMPLTELIDEMFALEEYISLLQTNLRNASDLLNDCGYALQDGKWVDTENGDDENE